MMMIKGIINDPRDGLMLTIGHLAAFLLCVVGVFFNVIIIAVYLRQWRNPKSVITPFAILAIVDAVLLTVAAVAELTGRVRTECLHYMTMKYGS